MNKRAKQYLVCVAALLLLLPGCQLIPTEEARPVPPMLQDYKPQSYTLLPVYRGDLVLENEIRCNYSQADQEKLYFLEDGNPVSIVYVTVGQEVKAGDLLAEVGDNTALYEKIA
ncbi:MAG: hypothetical protein IKL04_07585, partial [Lachnospiraceae bacterium]|nr:hypothetical protein [Lachnospiraceae bacterium]